MSMHVCMGEMVDRGLGVLRAEPGCATPLQHKQIDPSTWAKDVLHQHDALDFTKTDVQLCRFGLEVS